MGVVRTSALTPGIFRWIARVWASLLFLLWGAFFVEHAGEWFAGGTAWPPVPVLLLTGVHLALLIGLVLGWRYELAGGLLTLVSAVVFFGSAAGSRALPFIALTAVPAAIWIGLALTSRRR